MHIFYLVGFRTRVLVMYEWAWAYLCNRRGARIIEAPWAELVNGPPPRRDRGESRDGKVEAAGTAWVQTRPRSGRPMWLARDLEARWDAVTTLPVRLLRGVRQSGQLLNATEIAQSCGVKSSTIGDWLGLPERNLLIHRLRPFFDNLNKRLLKTPKLYFLDVGLAARLQGWSDATPLLQSQQAGHLFETLVFGEIVRTRDHHERDWSLFYWRTKEGEEVDFVVSDARHNYIALDAKLAELTKTSVVPLPPPAIERCNIILAYRP